MSLTVKDVEKIFESYAPRSLKLEGDNVGLMVGEENCEVTSILIALDCTLSVIEEAKKNNCNFILTHHPLLYKKPASVTDETLIGKKILKLVREGINLYSSHTNLDAVSGGLNDILMELLGFENSKIIEPFEATVLDKDSRDELEVLKKAGIGRFIELQNAVSLEDLAEKVKSSLDIPYVRYVGEASKQIKNIAVINGSGQDYFEYARRLGAECIITGDTTYHYISDYSEMGLAVIDAGHFGTEWPAFKALGRKVQDKLKKLGFNNSVLISQAAKDPFKLK